MSQFVDCSSRWWTQACLTDLTALKLLGRAATNFLSLALTEVATACLKADSSLTAPELRLLQIGMQILNDIPLSSHGAWTEHVRDRDNTSLEDWIACASITTFFGHVNMRACPA